MPNSIDLNDPCDPLPLTLAAEIARQWEIGCAPEAAPTRAEKIAFIRGLRWAFAYHHQLAAAIDRFDN